MRIERLRLQNFRNYKSLDFSFPKEEIIILKGKNAQGKTNLIESLVMLSLTKSFQPIKQEELMTWGDEFARIIGNIETSEEKKELEIFWGKTKKYPKSLKINEVKKKADEYIGNLYVVLFTPQEINLLVHSPQMRRRYIDLILSQSDKLYLRTLTKYQQTLKNRNALLKSINLGKSNEDELAYWDNQLVEQGAYIYHKRRELIKEINETLSDNYTHIAGKDSKLEIMWKKEIPETLEEIEAYYKEKIETTHARDIATETTLSGPHRDDISFIHNDKDITLTGSRGEWRSAILALKLSENEHFKRMSGESPILLLDDVLSEFDNSRQENVLKLFHADQIIITTTHIPKTLSSTKVLKVTNGTIEEETTSDA